MQCDQAGCLVRLVTSGETIRAGFSPAVRDTVRVRQQQLVAIDTGPSPEIAWRWYRGVVEEVRPEGVTVRRIDLPAGERRIVVDPEQLVREPGQPVYYGRHDDEWRVIDTVIGEGPARGTQAGYLADAAARIPG